MPPFRTVWVVLSPILWYIGESHSGVYLPTANRLRAIGISTDDILGIDMNIREMHHVQGLKPARRRPCNSRFAWRWECHIIRFDLGMRTKSHKRDTGES